MGTAYGYRRGVSDVVPSDPGSDPWRLRASDADREAYVGVLQQAFLDGRLSKAEYDERMAAALQARTYADLASVLAELPVEPGQVPGPPIPAVASGVLPAATGLASGDGSPPPIVALFCEVSRESRWTVPDGQSAVAVFGSVKLDLRTALLESSATEVRANAFFGSVQVIVPGDISVQVDGFGAFGEYKRTDNRTVVEAAPGGPTVRVSGLALFGSVEVIVVDAPVTGTDRVTGPSAGPAIGS